MARLRRAASSQVLVATTVIEVGVDVPNATRDGHRARRALRPGAAPPAPRPRRPRRRRLDLRAGQPRPALRRGAGAARRAWSRTDDGFVIAEKDLEIRGPGDFFGTRQWGMPALPRAPTCIRDRDAAGARARGGVPLRGGGCAERAGGAARVPGAGRLGAPLRPGEGGMMPHHRRAAARAAGCKSPAGDDDAAHRRPRAADAVRHPGPAVPGCRFLDAFAGSGGIGLEALSRGAARVVLVDDERAPRSSAIREQRSALAGGRAARCEVFRQDARVALAALARARASASTSSTWTRPTRATSTSRCCSSGARRACSPRAASWWPSTSTSARSRRQ